MKVIVNASCLLFWFGYLPHFVFFYPIPAFNRNCDAVIAGETIKEETIKVSATVLNSVKNKTKNFVSRHLSDQGPAPETPRFFQA